MKVSTKVPATLVYFVRSLARGLGRLDHEQGRIARRFAREAVLKELRNIRQAMDTQFPPIAKAPPANVVFRSRGKRTVGQLMAVFKGRMQRKNYGPVSDTLLALAIAKSGVRLIDPPKRTQVRVQYAPTWAIVAAVHGGAPGGVYNTTKILEVKKSVTARKALLAASALGTR
jgi:hypothetical protein